MFQRNFLMVVFGLFFGVSTSYAQQKEYITFSDTKGKVLSCKGAPGFGGSERYGVTLTIKYPTLPAYQKQYSKEYIALDPDPPSNLTLEQGGFDGPCRRYETDASKELGKDAFGPRPSQWEIEEFRRKWPPNKLVGTIKFCENGKMYFQIISKSDRLQMTDSKPSLTVPALSCRMDKDINPFSSIEMQ